MNYEIEQVHAIYKNSKLETLIVLWVSSSDGYVRATYANTKPIGGYHFLKPNEVLTDKLIQQVAGAGMNCTDELKKVFKDYKKLKFGR